MKITALVLVYVLRMAFLQTLIASPNIAHISTFKVTLSQHQSKSRPHIPVTHRSHVQQHATFKVKLPQILSIDSFQSSLLVIEAQKIYAFKPHSSQNAIRVYNYTLKRYRLYRTFLI